MAKPSTSVDLGLSAFPEIPQEKYPEPYVDAVRVRNAINLLAFYLDTYTGNTGTGASAFEAERISVGNGQGWTSFPTFTYDDILDELTVGKIGGLSFQITAPEFALYSASPVVQAAAFTLTFSTASRVVPNATFTNLATTAATNVVPYGFATQAQADNIATQVNALAADVLILKELIVALINDTSATLGIGINAT